MKIQILCSSIIIIKFKDWDRTGLFDDPILQTGTDSPMDLPGDYAKNGKNTQKSDKIEGGRIFREGIKCRRRD